MAEPRIAFHVHYKPLAMIKESKRLGFDVKNYPKAYAFFENEITLPLNTRMTEDDVEYVIDNFVDIIKQS